jgi:hypothetical protein
MRRRPRVALSCLGVLAALWGANALAGGGPTEKALRDLDQRLLQAYADAHGSVPAPRVDGFSVERRIPMPVFSYYEGQSLVAGAEVSCAARKSVVLWYGTGAAIVWQDGVWFPDRSRVVTRFVETGHLR